MEGSKNGEIEIDNTNKIVKFYYSILKERQNWLMSRAETGIKNMTALLLFNTAILLVILTILIRNQLPFCLRRFL